MRPLPNCSVSGWEDSLLAATFDAPIQDRCGFRPLSSRRESGIPALLSASSVVIESRVSYSALRVRAFGPVDGPRMPSADSCRSIPPPLDGGSTMANRQVSPANAHSPSRLCPPHLRPRSPYRYRTLSRFAFSSGAAASYAVSVRRVSALPAASFRFHLAVDTLAVRLTVPLVGPVGDSHPQMSAPCRAHEPQSPRTRGGLTIESHATAMPGPATSIARRAACP